MSVVISTNYVITGSVSGGGVINGDNPVIGWKNLVTPSNVTSTTAAMMFPASNLANPSTNLKWVGLTSSPAQDEFITVDVAAAEPVDYVAVAKHNFGSAQIAVSVEYLDESVSPAVWAELVAPVLLPNDGPALFRFAPTAMNSIRLRLQPGTAAPTAAVLYIGALLVVQRRVYVGHTPVNFGRVTKVTNGRSESGNFLGRVILNQMTQTSLSLTNLTPDWYRTFFEPFVQAAYESPFFFAWRPQSYPREVGFVWLTNDPTPSNASPNGMMQVQIDMVGIV